MTSWQAHATSLLLRKVFKPRLLRATEIATVRKVMTTPAPQALRGTRIAPSAVGGIAGEWLVADDMPGNAVLLYLHGGGYIACNARMYRPVTCRFAQAGFKTFAPDYRLAPEHPFPAALDDVLSVYQALLSMVGARQLVVAGDSAGGGLCAALLLSLRERGIPLPAAAAFFSPMLDLTASGESVRANAELCAMFTGEMFAEAARYYVGERDRRHPLCSPVYADLHGLPPLVIHVGENETLLDDSRRFAANARAAGVPVEIKIWPVVPHVWQLFSQWIPEGRESIREVAAFLARYTGLPGAASDAGTVSS
jgi:acetyl esterase/lipase